MFDIGWSELVVIGVVSLVVIGPKELPGVIRNVGRAMAKLRSMAGDFRHQFDEAMREADLADVKKDFAEARDAAAGAYQAATSPVTTLKDEIVTSISEDARALEAELRGASVPDPTSTISNSTVAEPMPAPSASQPAAPEVAAITDPGVTSVVKPKRRKKAVTPSGKGGAGQENISQENSVKKSIGKEGAAS